MNVRATRSVYRHDDPEPRGEQYASAATVSVRVTLSVYSHRGGEPRVQYGSAGRLSVRTAATAQRHTPPTGGPTYLNTPCAHDGLDTTGP